MGKSGSEGTGEQTTARERGTGGPPLTLTSGSEGDGEETTGPKAGTGASPSTLRLDAA